MEIWKKIKDYDKCEVSNYGNIRDTKTHKLRTLTVGKNGYLTVNLWLDNKSNVRTVHRLVAEAFIPNAENKPTVNHKDGNKLNNNVSNLEWNTYAENNTHAWRVLDSSGRKERLRSVTNKYFGQGHIVTKEARIKMSEVKKKPILCVETGNIYSCALDASMCVPVSKQMITNACNGRCKSAGGFHWKYLDK